MSIITSNIISKLKQPKTWILIVTPLVTIIAGGWTLTPELLGQLLMAIGVIQ